jgi:hypothetical protein
MRPQAVKLHLDRPGLLLAAGRDANIQSDFHRRAASLRVLTLRVTCRERFVFMVSSCVWANHDAEGYDAVSPAQLRSRRGGRHQDSGSVAERVQQNLSFVLIPLNRCLPIIRGVAFGCRKVT